MFTRVLRGKRNFVGEIQAYSSLHWHYYNSGNSMSIEWGSDSVISREDEYKITEPREYISYFLVIE